MIRGFYSAGSGLSAFQKGVDNVANNLANVNTTAYKKQSVRFSDLLTSNLASPAGEEPQDLKVGNGVRASGTVALMSQGAPVQTGQALDFALICEGFFGVADADGNLMYTRDGNFHISSEADGNYLVNGMGEYVIGRDGEKILVDEKFSQDKIAVFNFDNPYGLSIIGNNRYEATDYSGEAFAVEGVLAQGYLENSNTDITVEISELISLQKAYQFNAKMIQTADEIENIINNLR
ncbi:MAG: flagellar hook-basal body protein [Clostridiales bacterium]|nr:flagellar hook-basal body protein [Clostridiales bacterium]